MAEWNKTTLDNLANRYQNHVAWKKPAKKTKKRKKTRKRR
jgi:hypothetical protein